MPSYTELANSTFMDLTSYRSNASGGPTGGVPVTPVTLNVALVLDRANDPTALLQSDWGTRQEELQTLNDTGTLWTTYGADPAKYDAVLTELASLGIKTVDQLSAETGTPNGYVSSAESRTVWVQVDHESFSTLFGPQAKLMTDDAQGEGFWYWTNSLSLPTALANLGVEGIWFDTEGQFAATVADPGTGTAATDLPQHWQSPGNASAHAPNPFPQEIGDYYRMPLDSGVPTGTIGLIEPGVGTALPGDDVGAGFQAALDTYRQQAGVPTGAPASSVAGGGQEYPGSGNAAGERSLDVGVVSTVAPNSPLVLYAGSGTNLGAQHTPYTAYQSAFWDQANNPPVIGASPDITEHVAPGSPFYKASTQLFVDAALRNMSVFNANGDGGSGGQFANGLTDISSSRSLGYSVMVGGTSLSTTAAAEADQTLTSFVELARSGDRAAIWTLVAGGMTHSPVGAADKAAAFVETIWNHYYLQDKSFVDPKTGSPTGGYQSNSAGAGGADPSQPVPQYQEDYGLAPVTADPDHLPGRGTPDVSANAGGNMFWTTPDADMSFTHGQFEGTSAAAPFWAALGAQLSAVFADHGLPQLGYMNDLLYIASAIAPPSFNDITVGNNTSSFVLGGKYTSDGTHITPTGYGYEAGPGYDLASGLGTPNGTLLARALTAIGHSQMSFGSDPDMLDADGSGWTSGADQSLMFQAMSGGGAEVDVTVGSGSIDFFSGVSGAFAWTNRFAQQSLQADFDASLVRLYDKQAQGWVAQDAVSTGEALSVSVNASSAEAIQGTLSSPFGFADFLSGDDGAVRVARPVAVAETAGGQDDQSTIVRLRQNGEDNLSLSFYRVDDLSGTISGLQPGTAGYAAAAQARAYELVSGGTAIGGPGYGNYGQAALSDVDAGDVIAMRLTNTTSGHTYWGFAQANEIVDDQHVGHLWNYGLNTWGFEDLHGGGDRDFNDLVVQLDFTSAAGHGWLI